MYPRSFRIGLLEPASRPEEVPVKHQVQRVKDRKASRKPLPPIFAWILADAGSGPGEYIERWTAGRGAE